jgi:hypothetical protein
MSYRALLSFLRNPKEKFPQPFWKPIQKALECPRKPLVPSQSKQEEKRSKSTRDTNAARMQASTLVSNHDNLIESLRKSVKGVGKEVSFVRLTPEEKAQLFDIVYTYKRQGIKTSENEINRIAINFLIHDYEAHVENSLLAKVLAALNA